VVLEWSEEILDGRGGLEEDTALPHHYTSAVTLPAFAVIMLA